MTTQRTAEPTTQRLISRRTLIGSAAGVTAVALAGAGYANAQQSTPGANAPDTADVTTLMDRAREIIALVEADRASVSPDLDISRADQLLGFANDLLDQATGATATTEDEIDAQGRLALGAVSAAMGARAALVAALSSFGLPSQEAPASRGLATTHEWITESTEALTASGVTEATLALDFAEELYTAAYDAFTAGRYAEAEPLHHAANRLLRAGLVLSGELADHPLRESRGDGTGFLRRRDRRDRRDRRGDGAGIEEWGTPVDVPAPSF
jgi:TolA-binding protein